MTVPFSPPPPAGCTDCEGPRALEAIILYPSLGTPMVLKQGQRKCSLILGTGADALAAFDVDAQRNGIARNGHLYVDRHLRLSAIDAQKPIDTDITVGELYADGKDCQNGEKHIRVWHLGRALPGKLIRDRHGAYAPGRPAGGGSPVHRSNGRPLAILAQQSLEAVYPSLSELWEVQLDLEPLYKTIGSDAFMNWSWMVKTTETHKNAIRNQGNHFLTFAHHEPQDRLIDNFLRKQCEDAHHHYPHDGLYERNTEAKPDPKNMDPIVVADLQRLQSWHPVIRATRLPLKLGHVSDVHVNVRHHAMSRSPAKVLEDALAGDWNRPVGERVCHSYMALKELFQQVGKSGQPDTAMLLTGDLLDFNRNIDPADMPTAIGEQWKTFNVLNKVDDKTLYKRGMDDILVYSLVRHAYTTLKLPVFMTSGNHEAYAMPYGISPRVEFLSWSFQLGAMETTGIGDIDKHRQELDAASEWVQGKGNEGISADHNLTIYEATLAFGPTYAQVYHANNFDQVNFDWFHALFTPLEDCCLALGAEPDDKASAPAQVLTPLGWGQGERFTNIASLAKLSTDAQVGADMRGTSFLPWATQSMDESQLALIAQGQAYKRLGGAATPWTVASHFTVFNYRMDVPLDTKEAAFTAFDAPATDPTTLRVSSAQFNRYNFGGCERGLMSYFTKYVNQGAAGVDHHFSGHSHRSALIKASVSDSGFRVTALASGVQVRALGSLDPGIVGELDAKTAAGGSGTAFIVSSCGGPIGVQNLTGELSGWTLRPPSGTLLDGSKISQLKTTRQAPAQGHNEKPRLGVALDYLHVMGQDKDLKIDQPLLMCDPVEARLNPHSSISSALSVFGRPSTRVDDDLPEYVLVRESQQLAALNCVVDIKVWVFEGGGADDFGDESPGAWKTLPVQWDPTSRLPGEHGAMFSKLTLGADAKAMLKRLMVPIEDTKETKRSGEQVLQAFCEVTLKDPASNWSGDMDCTDPWTFPLEIAMLNRRTGMGNFKTFLFRRPQGEKGEVPDWDFLVKHFDEKGYIDKVFAIDPDKQLQR